MADNRLIINPLLEENMNQMADGEFAISQITGHVDVRREDNFLSKTKELQAQTIDSNKRKQDLSDKVNDDKNKPQNIESLIKNIKETIESIKTIIDEITQKIIEYENKADEETKELSRIDTLILDTLYKYQKEYFKVMNASYETLAKLLVQVELSDRISENNTYYNDYINNWFKYLDSDGNIQSYDTINKHESNWNDVNNKLYRTTYAKFIEAVEGLYTEATSYFDSKVKETGSDAYFNGSYSITNPN
jgi:chromosome segregation ATPase